MIFLHLHGWFSQVWSYINHFTEITWSQTHKAHMIPKQYHKQRSHNHKTIFTEVTWSQNNIISRDHIICFHTLQIGCQCLMEIVLTSCGMTPILNHMYPKFYWLYSIARDITVICGSDNQFAKQNTMFSGFSHIAIQTCDQILNKYVILI